MRVSARPLLARIVAIDAAVRSSSWPNANTLAKELEVNPRTVQRDIIFLRDRLGAPLEFIAAKHGYYYSEPDKKLSLYRITEGERVALFLAERLLRWRRG